MTWKTSRSLRTRVRWKKRWNSGLSSSIGTFILSTVYFYLENQVLKTYIQRRMDLYNLSVVFVLYDLTIVVYMFSAVLLSLLRDDKSNDSFSLTIQLMCFHFLQLSNRIQLQSDPRDWLHGSILIAFLGSKDRCSTFVSSISDICECWRIDSYPWYNHAFKSLISF